MNYESTIAGEDVDFVSPHDLEQAEAAKRKRLIIALVAIGVLLAGAAYWYFVHGGSGAGGGGAEAQAEQAATVTVMVPGKQTVSRTITATGTLAARRDVPVGVVGEGGRVTRVYVDAGDWVRQGQVLASIDRSVQVQQLAGLEASINASQADLNLAQSNLDRAEKLVDRGFISKADIDRLTATRDAADARVKVARAQLAESQARTARLNIVAPKGGLILDRNIEVGATVTQGSGMLFRIAEGGQLELRAQVSENDLAELSVGKSAEVTPVGTSQQFSGQIWQLSPLISEQSRQGIARIALPYDRALRPGGFAQANILAGSGEAPLLPESAVMSDDNGNYVYIVDKENKVVRRDVTAGEISSTGVPIVDGLSGTERIVLRAGGFLNPGETVRPVNMKSDAK